MKHLPSSRASPSLSSSSVLRIALMELVTHGPLGDTGNANVSKKLLPPSHAIPVAAQVGHAKRPTNSPSLTSFS